MEKRTGTIEDIIEIAKQRSSDPEEQARYIQIGIDLIKRDYSDLVTTFFYSKSEYDYQITGFADTGLVYFWYNIYRGTIKVASVLEVQKSDEKSFSTLFTSNKDFPGPIMPTLIET